ncbi:BTAD domain-containing putative transcriptional regulator [Streptomyces sp. NPDC048142]|uniref:BTAD domain-containing putative transcriptional regulator n=1 Tax=Streptomyces sp. NPDC048142 TaxID=3365501 RepID=UPI003723C94F
MEVLDNTRPVGLGGTKQRATLAYLLLHANKVVATSQLMNALWGESDAPMTARKILQNAVYGLRSVMPSTPGTEGMGGAALLTQPPGYTMRVDPERLDLHRFQTWAGQGRSRLAEGAPEAAVPLLRDALALWRGPALADLVESGVRWPELTAIENTRLDAMEDCFEAQLACGRHHEILTELETMVQAEPLRERSCGQLMLALYRCGRQADALTVYSRVRSVLVEDLGLEPGRGLQRLQQSILTQDPGLAPPHAPVRDLPAAPHTGGARTRISSASSSGSLDSSAAYSRPPAPVPRGEPRGTDDEAAAVDQRTQADRRLVSIVCVRIRLAPSLGSGAVQKLDDLLDGAALLVREQIERFGGTVMASIGSVTMALFRLDGPDACSPDQAVLAALAIRDVLDASDGSGSVPDESMVHATVTMGEVLLRRRGREETPTVIGAVLDQAQATLADVPSGEVWVSPEIRAASRQTVVYRRCETSGTAWQALGVPSTDITDTEQAIELDVLCGLMNRTLHRASPHLVTVLGEAGTGKSRLLDEFTRWLAGQPDAPHVLSVCTPRNSGELPLAVAGRLLSMYCGVRPGDGEEAALAALEREVRALYPSDQTARLRLSRLRCLVAFAGVEVHFGEMCPGEVLDAWREFMQEAAQRRPLVLCIDDLHHAPDMTLDVIEELAESTGAGRLFVVACAGPELLARRPSWSGGRRRTTTVTLDRPERISNEQLVEFLLSVSRSEGSQSFSE